MNHGNGTATDNEMGLQWELKTDDGSGSVHDKDNKYTWNTMVGGTMPNGTAFTGFLATLNGAATGVGDCTSADSSSTTGRLRRPLRLAAADDR